MNNTNMSDFIKFRDSRMGMLLKSQIAQYFDKFKLYEGSQATDALIEAVWNESIANMQKTIDEQKALIEQMREALLFADGTFKAILEGREIIINDYQDHPITKCLALSSPVSEKAK